MKINEIKELLNFIDSSNLTSVKLNMDGIGIEVSKANTIYQSTDINYGNSNNEKDIDKCIKNIDKVKEDVSCILAPLVGTFYTSPTPQDSSFVQVGDIVNKGDTLCILEAMKLMNEVSSDVNGEVIEILAKNEDLVQYNQPLFKIRPL